MRTILFLSLYAMQLMACNTQVNPPTPTHKQHTTKEINTAIISHDDSFIDTLAIGLTFTPNKKYSEIKAEIQTKRIALSKAFLKETDPKKKKIILDKARVYFTDKLLNGLVPHWYGTVWDFNGYTNTPNDGVIACGYFVSTTLKHMGLKINRYKLAQQAGLNEAKSLQPNNKLLIYHVNETHSFEDVLMQLKKQLKDGLYFVGLSNHVGYIYVKDNELYFLNSDYAKGIVVIDKAAYSPVLKSGIYVIANITHNDFLIKSWLLNTVIPIKVAK